MSQGTDLTSCKLYLLRRSTVLDAQFASNISASEIATYVNSVALSELKESTHVISEACQDPVVVLLPSATYAGKIFRADERPIQYASGNNIDLNLSPLCLFHEPAMVRVSPPDSKQDARQIVLDLAAPLASHIPLLQAIFSMGTYEFSFRAIWPNKEMWLHSQVSLLEHHFDHSIAFLELVYVKSIPSRWKEIVMNGDSRPERVGYLYKQSSSGKEKPSRQTKVEKKRRQTESQLNVGAMHLALGEESHGFKPTKSVVNKKSKRWFMLKGIFLAYFKSRDESVPSAVVPLDYYIVRLSDEYRKGARVMSLDKCVTSFPRGSLDDFVLAAEAENENELRLWFQSTNGKCANTALNRVFGMPLLHQLCHNQFGYVKQKKLGPEEPLFLLPPFLTQCIKYLLSEGIDQEGIFRINHITTEVQMYRDYFDTGSEIDLHGTNPHCVAALIKSWLRELPEPLIPTELYSVCIQTVGSTKDKELKTEKILQIIEQIPLHALRCISYLASFARQTVLFSYLNKMTFEALAIVLAPCILRQAEDVCNSQNNPDYNPLQLLNETPKINEVVLIIFENSERIVQLVERMESVDALRRLSHEHEAAQASQRKAGTYTPSTSAASSISSSGLSHSVSQPAFLQNGYDSHQTVSSSHSQPHSPAQQRSPGISPMTGSVLAGSGLDTSLPASTRTTQTVQHRLSLQALPPSQQLAAPKHRFQLPTLAELTRPRNTSNSVIRSLNEELPPLKEGQITIFTPSGVTPTVTIEASPRSLRASSPKWGKRHRNIAQWKGGAVGGGRVSGTTSPVPSAYAESAPNTSRSHYTDLSEPTSEDEHDYRTASEDISRRTSEDHSRRASITSNDHSLSVLAMESKLLAAGLKGNEHKEEPLPPAPSTTVLSHTAPTSPRGVPQWSQPVSPDPEARLLAMIMALQNSQTALSAKVTFLEERLNQEIAERAVLESKLASLTQYINEMTK